MVRVLGQPGLRHLLLSFLILRVIGTNVLDGNDDDVLSDVVLLWGCYGVRGESSVSCRPG